MRLRGGLCYYILAVAAANRQLGHYARAHELLDRTEETTAATGEAIFSGRVRRERAMVFLGQNESERAKEELLASLAPLKEFESPIEHLIAATELMRLARGTSDEGAARERLETAVSAIENRTAFRPQDEARAVLDGVE